MKKRKQAMRKLGSVGEAIRELGGYHTVAQMTGDDPRTVSNWIRRGFPASLHWSLGRLLHQRGYLFDPEALFRQRPLERDW